MYFIFGIALGIICAFLIYKSDAVPNQIKYSVLIVKIISAVGIGLYYVQDGIGRGDTWSFFNMGLQVLEMPISEIVDFYLQRIPNQIEIDSSRTAFFLKFLIPLMLISFKNYWITAILSALLSYTIILKLIELYNKAELNNSLSLFLVICLLPSTLIWTSGIFKENLAFISLLLISYSLIRFLISKKRVGFPAILIGLIGSFIFFELRYFLVPALIIVVLGVVYDRLQSFKNRRAFLIIAVSFTVLIILLISLHPVINVIDLPEYIFMANRMILENFSVGLDLYYQIEEESWIGVFRNIPMAFINIFVRPFPWEWTKLEYAVFAIENYLFFTLLIWVLKQSNWRIDKIQFLQCAVLIFSLLIIAIATPNFGSLFRYKSIVLPILLLVFTLKSEKKLI